MDAPGHIKLQTIAVPEGSMQCIVAVFGFRRRKCLTVPDDMKTAAAPVWNPDVQRKVTSSGNINRIRASGTAGLNSDSGFCVFQTADGSKKKIQVDVAFVRGMVPGVFIILFLA